jgi:hypothetical protein
VRVSSGGWAKVRTNPANFIHVGACPIALQEPGAAYAEQRFDVAGAGPFAHRLCRSAATSFPDTTHAGDDMINW